MKTSPTLSGSRPLSGKVGLERVSALAGISVPIIFTVLVALESALRPGYSQVSNYISDLGIGPYAIIQNVNFIVSGLLIGFFALGTLANLPSRAGASMRNAVRATGIAAIGIILAGVTLMLWSAFPTDYSFFWIHTAVSFIAFFALGAAPILTWRSLKGDDSWGNYPSASPVGGILTVVAIFIFFFSLGTTFYGLTERLVVAVPLVWIAGTGAKFYSRTSRATDIPS